MTSIIAVCGTMGSGKSTVVENVAAAMPDCDVVFEDDFNRTTERSLEQIDLWRQHGADVGDFDLSAVIEQLQTRCPDHRGSPSSARLSTRRPTPQIILLETHFGRLHPALRPWIDYQIWIDTPADIAVMRKVAQFSSAMRNPMSGSPAEGLRWIEEFCRGYLTTTRKLFEMQRHAVREQSDLSIDGQGTPFEVSTLFLQNLPERFRPDSF
jgi:hypothetical protein